MEKIYENGYDFHVRNYVVYLDGEGGIFYDADFEKEVKEEDCLNLFLKGVVAFADGVYYKALSCTEDGEITFATPAEAEEDEEEVGS